MPQPLKVIVDAQVRINRTKLDLVTTNRLKAMFTRDNPQFYKVQRMGFWPGKVPRKITSVKMEDDFLLLPRGGLSRVLECLEERGYEVESLIDRSLKLERIKLELAFQLYPYQQEAVNAIVQNGNCVMRGPCGSGKTIVLLGAIAELKQPTLVIVHTEALRKQWSAAVSEWFGFVPGSIGGTGKMSIRPITIGMQQTIWRWADKKPEWIKQFGCIVGDEIHHWAARTFQVTAAMFPAAYRVGASADEKRKDGLEFMIYDTFGPVVYEIHREALVVMKRLLPVQMYLVKTDYMNDNYLQSMAEGCTPDWVSMINNLVCDDERNELILNVVRRLLNKPTNRILLLSERVQGCCDWQEIFESHGHPCGLMVGGQKQDTDRAIAGLKTGDFRIAVGTKIADEGLDIPQLTHVIITCPIHTHPKRLEQMTGRVARVCEGKEKAIAIYFWDHRIFPTPEVQYDDALKKRARTRAFINSLRKGCSDLYHWDLASNKASRIN